MSNQFDNSEIVHEGWLTKSPPTTRIWRARWRKRWFVLKHAGEIPGQYFLCYYTDRNCRKLKGQIDLDQCEQVDAGLQFENRKNKYQFMFDVKTPKRTYYLAAESEDDMNRWVDSICHICGLKTYTQDISNSEFFVDYQNTELSPPISPSSTVSGPYIPISECISGKPLSSPDGLSDFLAMQNGGHTKNNTNINNITRFQYNIQQHQQQQQQQDESYDAPRQLQPPPRPRFRPGNLDLRRISAASNGIGVNDQMTPPPPQSPGTDGESVFTDDESIITTSSLVQKPMVNWETFPRPSDSSLEGDIAKPPASVTVNKRWTRTIDPSEMKSIMSATAAAAPPRPPKPSHLTPTSTTSCQNCQLTNCDGNNCQTQQTQHQPHYDHHILPPPQYSSTNQLSTEPNQKSQQKVGQSQLPNTPKSDLEEQEGPQQSPSQPVEELGKGSSTSCIVLSDDMYDFPRSHQTLESKKTSYTNANIVTSSTLPQPHKRNISGEIFRYDFETTKILSDTITNTNNTSGIISGTGQQQHQPFQFTPPLQPLESPIYSNLPSSPTSTTASTAIVTTTPPIVNRELKPGRKLSDSNSTSNSNETSPIFICGGSNNIAQNSPSSISMIIQQQQLLQQQQLQYQLQNVSAASSISGSIVGVGGGVSGPPNINRKLKPSVSHHQQLQQSSKKHEPPVESPCFQLASPPVGSFSRRKQRAAPSPIPPQNMISVPTVRRHSTSDDDVRTLYNEEDEDKVYFCNNTKFHTLGYSKQRAFDKIQYLDLDFIDTSSSTTSSPSKNQPHQHHHHQHSREGSFSSTTSAFKNLSLAAPPSESSFDGTTYKTIDFLKTEAFNRTRQEVEIQRQLLQCAQATL